MTDDQARQEKPTNEFEVKLSNEAIEDLEPDKAASEAVKGGDGIAWSGPSGPESPTESVSFEYK